MPSFILQIWGGVFYLLNKIFFSQAERSEIVENQKLWFMRSWIVYMIGLPGWAWLFVRERNWIAFSVETGGLPAMILGLVIALRGKGQEPAWLDKIAKVAVVIGISFSLYDYGGFNTISQWLELSLVTGFLLGTYMLAKKNPKGYLWFMLMNISCAALTAYQGWYWLTVQQVVSLGFVIDAYRTQRRRSR